MLKYENTTTLCNLIGRSDNSRHIISEFDERILTPITYDALTIENTVNHITITAF